MWIVEDRISDGYFDGSVKQKLDSASWLVAGWLTSSLQKEISVDYKEVTKASVGANILGWSLGKEVLLGCILASKRADSTSKRLTKLGTAGGDTCKATPTLKSVKVY
ncbi:hypothetical protein PIB30_056704 [Stylosanthes scabra]|uniref:Uncharacterized protein n=1 Tax=Stylosanthes scabra TaxID=79078 RepID=A0ABU6TJU2_9FABA|nr:hypothetical protein [Stylosanthes scabra]